jgi:hypothetical protein
MFALAQRLFARKPTHKIGPVHSLRDHPRVSQEQYEWCLGVIPQIQDLYDGAGDYIKRRGLDPALAFPGNEWGELIATSGIKLPSRFNDVNYLRLNAPFTGYHLPILDRLDRPQFATAGMRDFVMKISREGIPDDVVDQFEVRIDPAERLRPHVEEYLKHIRNVPPQYIVQTPHLFGEIGIQVDGALVNPDVTLCQSRVNALLCTGVLDRLDDAVARRGRIRVVEVGPGYGALGQALRGIYGERLEYVGVDLPTSLYHTAIYLGVLAGPERSKLLRPGDGLPSQFGTLFVANYLIDEIADALAPVDLAINTMSFCEMSEAQVRRYGELFHRWIGREGSVFEENGTYLSHHVDSKAILSSIFPHRTTASSDRVATQPWCQDIWRTS